MTYEELKGVDRVKVMEYDKAITVCPDLLQIAPHYYKKDLSGKVLPVERTHERACKIAGWWVPNEVLEPANDQPVSFDYLMGQLDKFTDEECRELLVKLAEKLAKKS